MKKGVGRIAAGAILIVLQILSMIGNAYAGAPSPFNGDVFYMLGYFLIGIIGVITLVCGLIVFFGKKLEEEKETPNHDITVNRVAMKTKFFSFLKMHQKALKIILIVCCVSAITCLIGHIVCDNNMSDALYHYDIAYERQGTTGCGEWSCKYCEGKSTPAPNYLFHGYGSPYEFRYYRSVSDTRTYFELVWVVSFVFVVFLLIVWLFVKFYHRAKNRDQI